jgi:hypothetical protein
MRWLLALALALTSCATRAEPYRFRGPLLGGVTSEAPGSGDRGAGPGAEGRGTGAGGEEPRPGAGGGAGAEAGAAIAAPETRSALLALVGTRTDEAPLAFALRAVRRAGVSITDFADVATLLARAHASAAFSIVQGDALALDGRVGNLVLFHDARVVGVVTSVAPDGTIEFVYASALGPTRAGRLVRRGFVQPLRPRDPRDDDGRALNTFVLPWTPDDDADQEHLAGGLFHGIVSVRGL